MDILRKGNKDLIKDINRYTVLNLIREKGEITRTEIAKKCDFGMSTLTYILDDLQQEGIILEGAETSSTGGRRAKLDLIKIMDLLLVSKLKRNNFFLR